MRSPATSPDSTSASPPAPRGNFLARLKAATRLPLLDDHLAALIREGDCRTVLDLGCGAVPRWQRFRPEVRIVGIETYLPAIEQARAAGTHDHLIHGDLLSASIPDLLGPLGAGGFDLVVMLDVIEHLPKARGLELLAQCEQLARRYVAIHTPNGFVPQDDVEGNPHQRHLSGWTIADFAARGYSLRGTAGPRFLHGYVGSCRLRGPGRWWLHRLLTNLLAIERHPERAFALLACKDLRGASRS